MAEFDVYILKKYSKALMLLNEGYVRFSDLNNDKEGLRYVPAIPVSMSGCTYVGNLRERLIKLNELKDGECLYNPEEPAPGDLYLGNTAPILVLQRPQNGTCLCINSFEDSLTIANNPTGSHFIVRKGSDRYLGNLNKMFKEFEKELLNSLEAS